METNEMLEKLIKDVENLSRQNNAILERLESIEGLVTPCEKKEATTSAQMSEVLAMLEKSPMGKNPMIAQMVDSMKTIMTAR